MPITIIAAVGSIAISVFLIQYGIFFFFLPIVFVPFVRIFYKRKKQCPGCGMRSDGNFCPRCGSKL